MRNNICRYNKYHSDLKLFISAGGNNSLAVDLCIPKSTVSSWKKIDFSKIISHPVTGSAEKDFKLFQKFLKNTLAKKIFNIYVSISDVFHSILKNFNNSINSFKDTILPVITKAKNIIGIANTLNIFRISRQRYDMWQKNKSCSASPIGLCVKQYPNQISKKEIENLKSFFSKITSSSYISYPLISLYFKALRENIIAFSQTSFYKYVKLLELYHPDTIRKKPQIIGIRATAPNQIWHADVTIFRPLDNTKIYIYLVVDNFSRYILSWAASLELSAKIRWQTLQEAYKTSLLVKNQSEIKLIVDGGPENKPIPIDPSIPISKLVAQQDITFSNSMIESSNKQLKYRYLFTKDLFNFDDTVKYLNIAIPEFNNIRPYGALKGLTPEEVYFKGMIPGKSPFDDTLKNAIKTRKEQNKLNLCPVCKD